MGDGRDWTFVLVELCAECGYDVRELDEAELGPLVRSVGRTWEALLDSVADDPRAVRRPAPAVWSPIEYGEHVRDVLALFTLRARRILAEDDPQFADWDPDVTADELPYGQVPPREVGAAIASNADVLAELYEGADEADLARPGRRSDGAVFTLGSLGRYMLHDTVHHVYDVETSLA